MREFNTGSGYFITMREYIMWHGHGWADVKLYFKHVIKQGPVFVGRFREIFWGKESHCVFWLTAVEVSKIVLH